MLNGNNNIAFRFALFTSLFSYTNVKVLDLAERAVFDQSYENIATENLNLNLTNEKSGVYFVNITIGNQQIGKKIIIQK